jgi:DNA-directed RNA polymerase beta subunit
LCPAETPEGQPCGIMNHLAMLGYCSAEYSSGVIFKWIKKFVKTANPIYSPNFNPHDWRIVVNGRVSFSFNEDVQEWIDHFKHSRSIDELPRDVSIYFNTTGAREVR